MNRDTQAGFLFDTDGDGLAILPEPRALDGDVKGVQ
jgi:hypothetical protein